MHNFHFILVYLMPAVVISNIKLPCENILIARFSKFLFQQSIVEKFAFFVRGYFDIYG